MKRFFIGSSDFRSLVEKQVKVVDKSLFIEEILEDKTFVKIFTRPSRFGKTTMTETIREFFQATAQERKKLFSELKIYNVKCKESYCVLAFNLFSLVGNDFDQFKKNFKLILSEIFQKYNSSLLKKDTQSAYYKRVINREINDDEMITGLKYLSQCLYNKYKKQIIILIDEFDNPIIEACFNNYYDKGIEFLRNILYLLYEDKKNLFQILVFGVLPLAIQEIFSGIDNFSAYTMLDEKYAQYFGFTANEIHALFPNIDNVKKLESWYGGYKIGEYSIYHPLFIMEYYNEKTDKLDIETDIYMGFKAILENLKARNPQILTEINKDFKLLLDSNTIEKDVTTNIELNQLNESTLWSLLVHSGLLSVKAVRKINKSEYSCQLTITNRITYKYFEDCVQPTLDSLNDEVLLSQLSC